MSHHADGSANSHLREAFTLQRRIATFILVFAVLIVALTMAISAVQFRFSPCQDRAHEVIFDNFVSVKVSAEDLFASLQSIVSDRRGLLDFTVKGGQASRVETMEYLDTADELIASHGFRLVRWSDGVQYSFELRAIFEKLCGTFPRLSMEVFPNVDYEKASYHVKALAALDQTVAYLQQSSLTTKEKNRITTVSQLQNVFPGFHELEAASQRVSAKLEVSRSIVGVSQVYFAGSPLDIHVSVQLWQSAKQQPMFWLVRLSTESLFAEKDLVSLQQSISAGLKSAGMLHNATEDGNAKLPDIFLR